jgi:TP901 family phage tail tape measure protein
MARTLTDEDIKLNIIINGNPAQKQLLDLEKSTRKYTEENKQLQLELKRVERSLGKNSDEYKKLDAEIKANTTIIDNNKATMKELQKQIGITGLTMKQLGQEASLLRIKLNNAVPGGKEYEQYKAELEKIKVRMDELKGKAQQTKLSISSIADGFNKYAALGATVIAGLTGVVLSVQKVIDYNGKLSESQANVMKTTGMSKKEVDELTKSFGLLQTRTSRIDLLTIAEQAGRIGIAKDEVATFVAVMDKANVALGDSFTGGVEEVANKLGKLKFLFKETKDMSVDQAYNSIGSAINDLGANGVASEANITEFATRLGSLPDVLKPSIKEALALGAAFEESGIEAEVSSRAYNIFMKQASTESGKFAKVMGLTDKAVKDMINSNPLDFMLKFAEGMRGMDATDTAKTLDYLGVNADGANKVIGAMGNNMGRFRELIDLSNDSFASGTSLINEYNIKNETLGATLDKIKKTVTGWFSSETFIKWLSTAVNFIAKLIGASEDVDGSISKWKNTLIFTIKVLAILISSLISYSVASRIAAALSNTVTESTLLFNLALKAQTFLLSLQKAGLIIYTSIMGFFGIATDKASASLTRLNLVTKLSPWGAVLAVLSAIVVAYVAFSDSLNKTTKSQETFAMQQKRLAKEVASSTAETKATMSGLMIVIQSQNVSLEAQRKAYEELVKINPIFNGFLKNEKINVEDLVLVYKQYIKSLDEVAYAKQFSKLNEGNIKKEIEAEQRLFEAQKKNAIATKELEDFRNKTKGLNSNSIDWSQYRKLVGAWDSSEKELKLAKANMDNSNKIVEDTNKFRENKIKELESAIKKEEAQLEKITDKTSAKYKVAFLKLEADKKKLASLIGISETETTNPKSNFNVPNGNNTESTKKHFKTIQEMERMRLDDEAKYLAELLKLQRQYEDDKLAVMTDSYAKDVQLEDQRYQREIDDLEKQKIHKEQFAKLDEEIAKAKQDKDTKYYNFLLLQKETWKTRNNNLDNEINKIIENKFSIHKLKLATIEEKWAQENIRKADEKFKREQTIRQTNFNNQLNQLNTLEKAKILLKDKLSIKELSKIRTLDDAKKELEKQFHKEELQSNVTYLNELLSKFDEIINSKQFEGIDLELLTPEQKDKFEKQVEEAKKLRSELEKALKGVNSASSDENKEEKGKDFFKSLGGDDIFGFSSVKWQQAYDNLDTLWGKMAAGTMVVQALQNAWGQYNEILTQNENSRLRQFEMASDKKKAKLQRQLDSGVISQRFYDKQVKKIDNEYAKEKAALEYKQAKRQKTMAIVDVVIKTAMAIMQGYAQLGPIGGTIAAVLLGTMGALQINAISKQPLPSATGYEKGLYGEEVRRKQDGKKFTVKKTMPMQSGLYSDATVLVGEGPGTGPEMVIDKQAYAQISPATKNALLRELRGIKGFESGFYDNISKRFEVPKTSSPSSNNEELLMMVLGVVKENTAAINELRKNPLIAKMTNKDLKSMALLQEGLNDADTLIKKTIKP